MHHNTRFLFIFLLLLAALLTGFKLSQLFVKPQSGHPPLASESVTIPAASPKTYTSPYCGISFAFPSDLTVQESTNAVRLTKSGSKDTIEVACGKELPKPPLSQDKIEKTEVASISATLYHDASAKDGSPRDVVMLTHPQKKLEVALFGFGDVFQTVLHSLTITQ